MNNIEHNKIYRPQHWGNKLGVQTKVMFLSIFTRYCAVVNE